MRSVRLGRSGWWNQGIVVLREIYNATAMVMVM